MRIISGKIADANQIAPDGEVVPDYRQSHLCKGENYDRDLSLGDFDTYMTVREYEILGRIVPRLFPDGVPRYLDFACGTGRITQLLEPMATESYGVDVSATMVEQARRKCVRTEFLLRDLTHVEAGIRPVNLVTAFRFFGNAQDELRRSALQAIRGVLVEGGFLILNNHRNPWSINNLLSRAGGDRLSVDLSPPKLRRLLAEAGFRIVLNYGIGLWVVRSKFRRPEILGSRAARLLEPVSRPFGPICPAALVVARRVR